jgi:hypothetical protein
MKNLNAQTAFISVAQASAADVVIGNGGEIKFTGVDAFLLRDVKNTEIIGSRTGNPRIATITYGTKTAGVTYEIGFKQVGADGETYTGQVSYVCPSPAPSDADFYAAIAAKVQNLITGNQILGTVSSSASGVVFTPALSIAVANLSFANLSAVYTSAVTFTPAGSTYSTGVLTSGAATGATTGGMYRILATGVTGADAALINNRVLYAKATSGTAFFLYGISSSATLTTTTGTFTVLNDSADTLADFFAGVSGFVAGNAKVGLEITFQESGAIDAGAYIPQAVIIDATQSTNANANDLLQAALAVLNGTSATAVLNTVGAGQ